MRLINQESLLKLLVVGSTINHLLVNTVCSMLRLLICLHYVQENRDELLVKVEDLKKRIVGSGDE